MLLDLLGVLRHHWRRASDLPARIERLLRADRRFGSRDRRLYRELIYATLRYLPWIEPLLESDPDRAARTVAWLAADDPATRDFRAALVADWPPCPPTVSARAAHLGADPAAVLPAWLETECPEAMRPPEIDALLSRAPLWLRLRSPEDADSLDELARQGWTWRRSERLPLAVEITGLRDSALGATRSTSIDVTDAYLSGCFEIQDIGSQLVLESAGIEPGGRWLDPCAGAGGKSLQLAGLLGPAGRVEAQDPRPAALVELAKRAQRAGLSKRIIVSPALRVGTGGPPVPTLKPRHPTYDGVLLDVPCSGSGTWRRSPHLKWTTTPEQIAAQAVLQRELLGRHAASVRPGGLLVYATCSLCRSENEDNVAWFLAGHPEFVPHRPGRLLRPSVHDGDGFFVATLRRQPIIGPK